MKRRRKNIGRIAFMVSLALILIVLSIWYSAKSDKSEANMQEGEEIITNYIEVNESPEKISSPSLITDIKETENDSIGNISSSKVKDPSSVSGKDTDNTEDVDDTITVDDQPIMMD